MLELLSQLKIDQDLTCNRRAFLVRHNPRPAIKKEKLRWRLKIIFLLPYHAYEFPVGVTAVSETVSLVVLSSRRKVVGVRGLSLVSV